MKILKIESAHGNGPYIVMALCLVTLAVFGRLLPHPPNFAPVAAAAIFGGAILPKRWALTIPLFAMILSDAIIGLYPMFYFTWGAFVLIALGSNRFIRHVNVSILAGTSLAASLTFYLVSNFGVWLQDNMYPMTFHGLLDCYYRAIPFFRNTVFGDLFFTFLLFGLYAFSRATISAHRKTEKVSPR